jgi:hypothetical protein
MTGVSLVTWGNSVDLISVYYSSMWRTGSLGYRQASKPALTQVVGHAPCHLSTDFEENNETCCLFLFYIRYKRKNMQRKKVELINSSKPAKNNLFLVLVLKW